MAWWTVRTYYKKSCEQREFFYHEDYKDPIIVTDGFRWCEYAVETTDDNPPNFEFDEVPGGDGKKDSVDLNNCFGNNIEQAELVLMDDGGCWGDVEFPEDMDDEEQERLQEIIDESGSYGLEEDGTGWNLSDTEVWIWGPIEITNDKGYQKIVCADENGNLVDFEKE
jgi:hypothetical protein